MYRESTVNPWAGALLIAGVFLLIYFGWVLYPRELFRQECIYAAQAAEFSLKNPMVTVHETPVRNAYPLYPALCSLLYRWGLPMEMALRLVTVFFIAAGGVLVYFAAASGNGNRAGLVATSMYCTTMLMLDEGVTGAPQTMSAFWLLAAQVSFFYFGLRRGKWNLAWPLTAFLLMLGFFSGGVFVLFLFLLPVFFFRRLIAGRAKYRNPGFPVAVVLVLLALFTRFAVLWSVEKTSGGTLFFRGFTDPDYLRDFFLFGLELPLRLLPWSFIAWIPFCAALQRLDDKPLFSKFLRINVLVTAAFIWLTPRIAGRELLYLPGCLSILTGVYYELGVRRFGENLRKLAPLVEYVALAAALAIAVGMWGEEKLLAKCLSLGLSLNFRSGGQFFTVGLTAMGAVLLIGILLRWKRKTLPVWIGLLSLSLICGIFYGTIMLCYQAQASQNREFGQLIRKTILQDMGKNKQPLEIFKCNAGELYGELFYSGARIIQLPSADMLPDNHSKVVYLISTTFPQNPKWSWKNLLPEDYTYDKRRIMLWRGKRNFQEKFSAQ